MIQSAHLSHRAANRTKVSAQERITEGWIRVMVFVFGVQS